MEPTNLLTVMMKYDDYKNANLDLTTLDLDQKHLAHVARAMIPALMTQAKLEDKHEFTVKLRPTNHRMLRLVKDCGMEYHEANNVHVILKKCLKSHEPKECNYPVQKTLQAAITAVIFNEDLTEFVCVEETAGFYRGPKPVTGTVDHELNPEQTPPLVFAREVKEETNVNVEPNKAVFAGVIWTPVGGGKVADVNCIFASQVIKKHQELKAQESEVRNVGWKNVQEFLDSKLPVKHEKPLILKEVVRVALYAMIENPTAYPKEFYWGSGKPCVLLSSYPRK